jgi:LysM repeat protein
MMKLRIRTLATFALVALTIGLFSLTPSALAVSDCQKAHGDLSVVNNGNGTTSGTITQGGRLNGTTQASFTSAFTPTPDANTFSFTEDLTLTTHKGVLKTHNVGIFDVATGVFSAINRIDPNTSTGDFAGATGVLYINGKTADGGATFQAEITGEICFAD